MDPKLKLVLEANEKVFQKEKAKLENELTKDDKDPGRIEARLRGLRHQLQALLSAQDAVLEYLSQVDVDKYEEQCERRSDIFAEMEYMEISASNILQQFVEEVKPDATYHRPNLPQRKLQEFNGDVREWLGFWSSFEDIDNDKTISDADKFQYLLQCIPKTSAARKVVDGFTVSARNYRAALNALKDVYARESMLVKVFVRDLLQLVIENATRGTKTDFVELYPKLSSYIRNLKQLGLTNDKCEDILYPVVESCLSEDILLAWQRSPGFKEKLDDLMEFLKTEVNNAMDRSLAKMQFSATVNVTEKPVKFKKDKKPEVPTAMSFMNTDGKDPEKKARKITCAFCNDTRHESDKCGKAKIEMSLERKLAALKEKNCCFKCLRQGHFTKKCKIFVRCCICGGQHYEIICSGKKRAEEEHRNAFLATSHNQSSPGTARRPSSFSPPAPQTQQQPQQISQCHSVTGQPSPHFSNVGGNEQVTLFTLMATIETPKQKWRVRVFIDGGSEVSYIKNTLAECGGVPMVGERSFCRQLFGGSVTENIRHPKYEVKLWNIEETKSKTLQLHGIDRIAQRIRKPAFGQWTQMLSERGVYFHDQSQAPDDVHIMIGMDVAAQIWTGGFIRINEDLYAAETIFGWVVGGKEPSSEPPGLLNSHMVTAMMVNEQTVENLWALEVMGITEDTSHQKKEDLDLATVKFFEDTVTRGDDGRYIVNLPWKEGHTELKGNFTSALSRLRKTTSDLKREGLWSAYDKIFSDWQKENIISEVPVPNGDMLKELYLLPHRHVLKISSSSTPVRPVFDASAKGRGGPSLNDCLATGPNLLELIPAIMCRFRKKYVGAVSDIRKAFLQIEVAQQDQQSLQFLWWKDSECTQLKLYKHQRVVFGVKPSPFLLAATLKHHLNKEEENYPGAAFQLLESLYVDNSCSSHDSVEAATLFQEKSQLMLLPAKFDLRGWEYSYSKEFKEVAVLGMQWETQSDTISLCMESVRKRLCCSSTKRGLLSLVNSLFDPMGFFSAVTVIPKLILQDCCRAELGWDDVLPVEIAEKVAKWKSSIMALENAKIPRWFGFGAINDKVTLHCFSDASGYAFATTIYLRINTAVGVRVQLVMSKSRVAPAKKKISIPRLELLGCGLGARLTANHVVKYLELEDAPIFYWTDSSTALIWITKDKDWGRFVANRVDAIRKISRREDWRHVPGNMNPADIPSRGCSPSYLIEKQFWRGPSWLYHEKKFWPNCTTFTDDELANQELKKSVAACHVQVKERNPLLKTLMRYSDYHQILRILAYIIRSLKLNKKVDSGHGTDYPTADEIDGAEIYLLRMIQADSFDGIRDKRLSGMDAFLDTNGLVRIKSQLLFGNDELNVRCPVVLPHDDEMVKVLIYKEHCIQSHAGVQITQASLRQKFWIMRSRRTIGGVVTSCPVCKRFTARRCDAPTAPLPYDRIRNSVAFDVTGVDLAGPLLLRSGVKVWIVLFTCSVFRAVHLELVGTLSTQGFLNAFRRFVCRRGRPRRVYSDNGLNFVGTSNLFKDVDWNEVQRYATVERISWRFNPPTAAWWGGWWERLVGLSKQLIRRILGKKSVEYEELCTIICEVESSLNQRPLTYVSDKKEELLPLCPQHFVKDNPNSNLPEADVVDGKSLRNNIKLCQKLREELRSRFRKEYLGQLAHQAITKTRTVKPRDVVIVEDENRKRLEWNLGIIVEVYPGRDGRVRTALVKTKFGSFLRPLQRLFLMEASEEDESKTEQPLSSEKSEENSEEEKVTKFGRKIKKPARLGIK